MIDLSNHRQSIQVVLDKHSQKVKRVLRWHGDKHPDVGKVILEKALQNDTLTCPMIQKDIVNACAKETLKVIIGDLNEDYFGILVDESKDISHKEQMTLVLRKYLEVEDFFDHVTNVLNVVGRSFKRRDLLRHHQAKNLKQLLESVLAMSNELSRILQKKDQDIVNFMNFLNISKKRLQDIRENGWKSLLDDVSSFFDSHGILIPKLDEPYFHKKSKHKCLDVCYSYHLRVEIFCAVIDVQLQELNDRFDIVSSDLLLGMGSLNSVNNFSNFDKGRIMTLAKYYPNEFDDEKLRDLSYQLDTFIIHMRGGNFKFSNLQEIRDLTKALVEENLVETYSLVYLFVKLALILPLSTTTVERTFSYIKHIKNKVQNCIGDQYLNNFLVYYIERDVFANVSNEVIVDRFPNMKTHRGQL
ncbi:uncharacterized protein LOC124885663 [Capsicum annuum]|uniref:uncharacterized protein LOC124885663 n=1 Tax=Capsicum annuum TaxID=4072 RepID=UPI001FB04E38|nr:uncharacterized protein LOC124885663 [Capsicum annuum]